MARYELILRLDGALWLTIIFKPLLAPQRATGIQFESYFGMFAPMYPLAQGMSEIYASPLPRVYAIFLFASEYSVKAQPPQHTTTGAQGGLFGARWPWPTRIIFPPVPGSVPQVQ